MEWNAFNKFDAVIGMYMPMRGEGDSKASQICTAVNKLIYKWFNDGDVYDNTYGLVGWANDLSDYANWLYKNVPESVKHLEKIKDIVDEDEYSDMLYDLAEEVINYEYLLENEGEKVGTIYDCAGPYHFYDECDMYVCGYEEDDEIDDEDAEEEDE